MSALPTDGLPPVASAMSIKQSTVAAGSTLAAKSTLQLPSIVSMGGGSTVSSGRASHSAGSNVGLVVMGGGSMALGASMVSLGDSSSQVGTPAAANPNNLAASVASFHPPPPQQVVAPILLFGANSEAVYETAKGRLAKWMPRVKTSEKQLGVLQQKVDEMTEEINALKEQLETQKADLKVKVETQMQMEWAMHVERLRTAVSTSSQPERSSRASSRSRIVRAPPPPTEPTAEQQAAFGIRAGSVMLMVEALYNWVPVRRDSGAKKAKRKGSKAGKYAEGGDSDFPMRPDDVDEELYTFALQLRAERLRVQADLAQREQRLELFVKRFTGVTQLVRITTYGLTAAKQCAEDAHREMQLWGLSTKDSLGGSKMSKKAQQAQQERREESDDVPPSPGTNPKDPKKKKK